MLAQLYSLKLQRHTTKTKKQIHKLHLELKETKDCQNNLERKGNNGSITIHDIKFYDRNMVAKHKVLAMKYIH